MHENDRHNDLDEKTQRPRQRRAIPVVVALALLALLAAACGGGSASPGVASVGSTTTTTNASAATSPAGNTGTSTAGALKYAQCMRSHGIKAFPDPNAQGGFSGAAGVNPNSSQYIAANKVCQPLTGEGRHLSQADQQQIEAHALKFAECMQSHGVPNYPDPTFNFSNGGVSEKVGSSSGALNARSPQFQDAQKACQSSQTRGAING